MFSTRGKNIFTSHIDEHMWCSVINSLPLDWAVNIELMWHERRIEMRIIAHAISKNRLHGRKGRPSKVVLRAWHAKESSRKLLRTEIHSKSSRTKIAPQREKNVYLPFCQVSNVDTFHVVAPRLSSFANALAWHISESFPICLDNQKRHSPSLFTPTENSYEIKLNLISFRKLPQFKWRLESTCRRDEALRAYAVDSFKPFMTWNAKSRWVKDVKKKFRAERDKSFTK